MKNKCECQGCGEIFKKSQSYRFKMNWYYCIDCVRKYIRLCKKCGIRTCWWHYKKEAITNWNKREFSLCLSKEQIERIKSYLQTVALMASGDEMKTELKNLIILFEKEGK